VHTGESEASRSPICSLFEPLIQKLSSHHRVGRPAGDSAQAFPDPDAPLHAHVPILAARVAHDPVLVVAGVGAVPDHCDGVVDSGVAGARQHPALVVLEGDGVDGHDDRLLRHGALQRGLAVGQNSRAMADPAAPALPLLALVGVLPRGGEAAVARDPPHGRRGIAAAASVVGRGGAVHELLL